MSIRLPPLLDEYFRADNAHGADAMLRCFAPDAIVFDEKREHRGAAAIRAWKLAASEKYGVTSTPVGLTTTLSGHALAVHVIGNFPGSPAVLQFQFSVPDQLIQKLTITA